MFKKRGSNRNESDYTYTGMAFDKILSLGRKKQVSCVQRVSSEDVTSLNCEMLAKGSVLDGTGTLRVRHTSRGYTGYSIDCMHPVACRDDILVFSSTQHFTTTNLYHSFIGFILYLLRGTGRGGGGTR
jgi:hypothetical protein